VFLAPDQGLDKNGRRHFYRIVRDGAEDARLRNLQGVDESFVHRTRDGAGDVGHHVPALLLRDPAPALVGVMKMLEECLRRCEVNKAFRAPFEVEQAGVGGENERLEFDGGIAQGDLVSGDLVEVRKSDVDEVMNVSFVQRHKDFLELELAPSGKTALAHVLKY